MMEEKRVLRKMYTQKRNSVDEQQREADSKKIIDKILQADFYKKSKVVFVYVSIGSEADTLDLIDRMLEDKKKIAVPLCDTINHTMEAIMIKSRNDLKVGAYNIPEPECADAVDKDMIDLCIVPALAFDRNGMRLGYGAGFYDRFLQNFKGRAVGIAFDECLTERLPHSGFDIAVDVIITPNEYIEI